MHDPEAVIQQIREGFAATRRPPDAFLVGSNDGCEPEQDVGPYHFVEPDEQQNVYVPEVLGGYFVFAMKDGAMKYSRGARRECRGPLLPRP